MSTLAIITITKNDPVGLKRTIHSTASLRKNGVIQLIVDGSDQVLQNTIRHYVQSEKNIRYLAGKESGIATSFNQGIKYLGTEFEWLWFLNGGDTVAVNLSPELLLTYLQSSHADLAIFQINIGGTLINRPPFSTLWPPVYNWVPHPGTIIRHRVFPVSGLFNPRYSVAMDGELWFRILSHPAFTTDLLSFPIADFDTSGISSLNQQRRGREMLNIIWHYQGLIYRRIINVLYLTFRAFFTNLKSSL